VIRSIRTFRISACSCVHCIGNLTIVSSNIGIDRSGNLMIQSLNPKIELLNPKIESLNHKIESLNHNIESLNPRLNH
jgi:hypothetical protein